MEHRLPENLPFPAEVTRIFPGKLARPAVNRLGNRTRGLVS
jgi:hypothetical protein